MPTNDVIKIIVVTTLCLALLAVIGLAYLGKVDPQVIVTFVLTSISGILGGSAAWLGATQKERARTDGILSVLRAEHEKNS